MWITRNKIDVYEKRHVELDVEFTTLLAESALEGNRGKSLRLKNVLDKDKNIESHFIIFTAKVGKDKYPIHEVTHKEKNLHKAIEIYNKLK